MDEEERNLVKKILEGVIVKNQVEKLLKPKPEKPWSQRFREITDRLAQGAKDYPQDDIDKIIDEAVASVSKKSYARF
jgi:Glu-tRNA(Gln) amidotransferase subunit E-like FAD-binding protein